MPFGWKGQTDRPQLWSHEEDRSCKAMKGSLTGKLDTETLFFHLSWSHMSSSHWLLLLDLGHPSLDLVLLLILLCPTEAAEASVYILFYPKHEPLMTYRFPGLTRELMREHLVSWRPSSKWVSSVWGLLAMCLAFPPSSRGRLLMKPCGWDKQAGVCRIEIWALFFDVFLEFPLYSLFFNPFFSWAQGIDWL